MDLIRDSITLNLLNDFADNRSMSGLSDLSALPPKNTQIKRVPEKLKKIDCKGKDKDTKVCKKVEELVHHLRTFLNFEKQKQKER